VAEKTVIQCRAALVALVVLTGLAIEGELVILIDAIVDEHAFLARKTFEAPATAMKRMRSP
jgi:hypothetical protein